MYLIFENNGISFNCKAIELTLIAESLVNISRYENIYVYLNEECSMSSYYNIKLSPSLKVSFPIFIR